MSWNAKLVDGPHEGRSVHVEEESSADAPAVIEVDGERYVYCGFADNSPRYRHEPETG
jgi:hypothetical protein